MRFPLLALTLLAATVACSDDTAPDRSDRYDWVIVDGTDTLTFHWLPAELPVKIWVENNSNLPDHVSRGITLWQNTVGTANYRGVLTSDSSSAAVIVRAAPIAAAAPSLVHGGPSGACQGETVIDTVASRFQLRVPIRINIEIIGGSDDSVQACLRRVAAHELGHSLGLFQHSANVKDLMYTFPAVDAPSSRDANTVITLYQTGRDMVPTAGGVAISHP